MVKKYIEETTGNPLEEDGYSELIGKNITVFCCRYTYYGKLIEEGKNFIKLQNPNKVYETGCFTEKKFKDIQSLNTKTFSINKDSVESFGILDNKNESE
jgi:hypothetical protein